MKLYITEKKTVAEALAPVLGKKSTSSNGLFYITNSGDYVTHLSGHVLELYDAKDYDPKYAKWDLDNLPILPNPFKIKPAQDRVTALGKQNNSFKRKILDNVLDLIKKADTVCLATDPDAEGELLGREVIEYAQYKGKLTRILPTSLEIGDISKCLDNEFCASKTELIGKAGLARSHIDWIVGINTTVGLTVYNRDKIPSLLNAGRVQTAIIKILHLNHLERENFKPAPIYEIKAKALIDDTEVVFNYLPTDHEKLTLDAKSENYNAIEAKGLIEGIKASIAGRVGVISKCNKSRKKSECPQGYSLSDLQIDCNNRFGMSASQTLTATQSLYDKKIVTYPRTDNNFFPEEAHDYAPVILENIQSLDFCIVNDIDPKQKNKNWDTSKFDNHHAILPTRQKAKMAQLDRNEQHVYELICRRYLMQFLPDYEYDRTTIELTINNNLFKCSGNTPIKFGWKEALITNESNVEEDAQQLPILEEGTKVDELVIFLSETKTKIKPLYTEAKLLQILKNPTKLFTSRDLAKVLKDREQGIGRESTRANILEQMKANGFYKTEGKKKFFKLTEKGLVMAEIAPNMLLDLELTAKLEKAFHRIEKGEITYQQLITQYSLAMGKIINSIKNGECALKRYLVKHHKCPECENGTVTQRTTRESKLFWKCVDCSTSFQDENNRPKPKQKANQCPQCNKETLYRFKFKGQTQIYGWYCKDCRLTTPDNAGKPNTAKRECKVCNSRLNIDYYAKFKSFIWRCTKNGCKASFRGTPDLVGTKITAQSERLTSPCPLCNGNLHQYTRKSDGQKFWLCSNRNNDRTPCRGSFDDSNDKPDIPVQNYKCPKCNDGFLQKKTWQDKKFWGCSNFLNQKKQCKYSTSDLNDAPVMK